MEWNCWGVNCADDDGDARWKSLALEEESNGQREAVQGEVCPISDAPDPTQQLQVSRMFGQVSLDCAQDRPKVTCS